MPQPTPDAINRIRKTVKRVEADPYLFDGTGRSHGQGSQEFWARIIDNDDAMLGPPSQPPLISPPLYSEGGSEPYSFEKVMPDGDGGWESMDPPVVSYRFAREINGNQGVLPGTIVLVSLIGYGAAGKPLFAFQYEAKAWRPIKAHDHADATPGRGGFACIMYAPGVTWVQPFAL